MSEWRGALRPVAPTRLPGSRPGGLYGMALLLLVLSVVGGVLIYSYAYLAANSDGWPPAGVDTPDRLPLLFVMGLAVVLAAGTTVAYRYAHADSRDRLHVLGALSGATLVGATALVLLLLWIGDLPQAGDVHAYTASVVVMAAFVAGSLTLGVLGAAMVSVWVVQGHAGTEPADAIRILRALHWFCAASAIVMLGVIAIGGGSS